MRSHAIAGVVAVLFGLAEILPFDIGRARHVADFPGRSVPLEGPFAPNNDLQEAKLLFRDAVKGSETIKVEKDGQQLLMIDKFAEAWHAIADPASPGGYKLVDKPFAYLGPARPLGFQHDAQGNVIVCDTNLGLVRLEPDNRVVLLASRVSDSSPIDPGSYITYANNLDISQSAEGTVYFSDSHELPHDIKRVPGERPYFEPMISAMTVMLTGSKAGRLLAYHPQNGTVHVLAKGFWFANGVALSEDESFVAIAETGGFKINRYWLKGPKAGSLDVLIDKLPGFPDNMIRAQDGCFWVAMPMPRSSQAYLLRSKILRAFMLYASPVQLKASHWGAIMKISPDGKVLRFLTDVKGSHISGITDVEEYVADGSTRLFMGLLTMPYVAYIDIKEDYTRKHVV